MPILLYSVIGFLLLLGIGIAAYFLTARKYQSSATVANSYDLWTLDGILEFYWGNTFTSVITVRRHDERIFWLLNLILYMKWLNGVLTDTTLTKNEFKFCFGRS